jgi:hypothetical protein
MTKVIVAFRKSVNAPKKLNVEAISVSPFVCLSVCLSVCLPACLWPKIATKFCHVLKDFLQEIFRQKFVAEPRFL